ncbi:MAG: amidohydrolase [Bacteroidales bacterium]|nr:amidohydrolase [Bacteroidales bacterium]
MDSLFLRNITLDGRQVDILIEDGRISSVRPHSLDRIPGDDMSAKVLDCTGKVAMPGFVNMHAHAAMSLLRGVGEDMVLKDWLDHIWAIEAYLNEPFVYWGTKVAVLEMIKTGTTTFNDMYWFSPEARKAAEESGLRNAVSFTFLDNFDENVSSHQKEKCQAMHETVKDWGPLSSFLVSVHSVYTVSESLMLWATEFARKNGLRIHIHVSETQQEVFDCKKAHGGLSPVEYFDSLGILGPDVIAAHALWLSDKDVEILGARQVSCVHNVNSNLKLASGIGFRAADLKEAGANVCIGTDGCASSNNLDMLEAMKTAAIVQKAWKKDPTALPLGDLLDMATVNGAKALGLRSGRIEEGWDADIQIIDTDSTFFLSPAPFTANYVYSAHSDCISSLVVGGRLVMHDRVVEGEKDILEGGRKELELIERIRKS